MSKYNNKNHGRNLILFEGMKTVRGIYPTDIDAFVEIKNDKFIFIECKYKKAKLPYGQQLALKNLVDGMKPEKRAILLIASHESEGDIMLADCIVTHYRAKEKTRETKREVTVKEFYDWFVNY